MRDDPRDSSNNSSAVAPQLTERQRRWIEEYLLDPNATQAAIRAGYSVPGARVQGVHMLTNPNIRQILAEERHARSSRMQLEADRVVEELMYVGLSDIRDVVTWDASGKPTFMASEQLSPEMARCIQRIEFHEKSSGDKIDRKIEVRLYDKLGALDSLMKHLGLFQKPKSAGESEPPGSGPAPGATQEYDWSKLSNEKWERFKVVNAELEELMAEALVTEDAKKGQGWTHPNS